MRNTSHHLYRGITFPFVMVVLDELTASLQSSGDIAS